jgi:hypothetical protein
MVAPSTVPRDADAPLGIRIKASVEPEAQVLVGVMMMMMLKAPLLLENLNWKE